MTASDCEHLHEIAPEVALGIADGEDRAWALEHLDGCPACRARIERLSDLADELLLLAPAVEPPAGFEARVGDAVSPGSRRPSFFRRRFVIPAAAALAAAACAAGAVWFALSDDRNLADSYRATLAVANGEYFDAAPMVLPGGKKAGYVYGYQGRASWVLAIVYEGVADANYQLEVVTRDGRQMPLRPLSVTDGHGSAGGVTAVPYDQIAQIRLLDSGGREVADSDL
jgi:hypothetical protein